MSVKHAVRRHDDSFVGGTCVRPLLTYCAEGVLAGMRQNEAQPWFDRVTLNLDLTPAWFCFMSEL